MKLSFREWFYIFLIFLTVVGSLVYQRLNKAPQIWDSAAHINLSMLYAKKITDKQFSDIPTLSGYYPPFVHLAGAVFFLVFPSFNSQLYLTFAFYILGIVFLYLLSRYFFEGNRKLALLTCVVFSLLPQVMRELRLFELDLPLTSLLITTIYFLHTSDRLTKRWRGLAFFIFFAFAQLTKWYAFVYIVAPVLFELLRYKDSALKPTDLKKVLLNIILGITIFIAFSLPWYLKNFQSILNFFGVYSKGELIDPQNPFSVENAIEYLKLISVYQLYFINFIFALFAILVSFAQKRSHSVYYLVAILFPYVVFTLITNKDARYLMPVSIYFCLFLAQGVSAIEDKFKLLGKVAVIGFLSLNVLLYFLVSFNQFDSLPDALKPFVFVISGPKAKYQWLSWNPTEMSYQKHDWKLAEVYKRIEDLSNGKTASVAILFAVDFPYFNRLNFDSSQIYNNKHFQVHTAYEDTKISDLESYDFILTSYNPGLEQLRHYKRMVEINRFLFSDKNTNFEQRNVFKLPNGEDVYLFALK